jgi:hypothetical protein
MIKNIRKIKPLMVASGLFLTALPCHAGLKVNGSSFDSTNFPTEQRSAWEIMKVKCIRCHSMERVVVSITSGISAISGTPFDRNAIKAYGLKMNRKVDPNMNKQEVKACVDLMYWMLDEVKRN